MTGKYLVIFILILAPMMQIPAFASKGKDYSEELERLDEILSKKEIYVQYLKDRIKGNLCPVSQGQDKYSEKRAGRTGRPVPDIRHQYADRR